jgi:hypothetical protein
MLFMVAISLLKSAGRSVGVASEMMKFYQAALAILFADRFLLK